MSCPEDVKNLKKLHNKAISVQGTKLNTQNAQLLVSTGIPSLDNLIGGGVAVGTIFLVEDDSFGTYGKILLKYFIAEGVVNRHSIYTTSQDVDPKQLTAELPALVDTDPVEQPKDQEKKDDKMSIAWRYQHLPTSKEEQSLQFGHYYDLSKKMPQSYIDQAEIQHWDAKGYKPKTAPQTFANPAYHGLLQSIKDAITKGKHEVDALPERRTVLRIALHSLGSPYWVADRRGSLNLLRDRDLDMFLYCLRALTRSAYAVAMITIPSEMVYNHSISRCIHIADTGVRLESFMATKHESNPALSDYNGFFHITKAPAINTLEPAEPKAVDFAFKLRRKKFVIEMLHLPPELEETTQREDQDTVPIFSCGSIKSKKLEF